MIHRRKWPSVVSRPEEGCAASLELTNMQVRMTVTCRFPAIRLAETERTPKTSVGQGLGKQAGFCILGAVDICFL